MAKTKVALLLGGDCSEREISWKTGQSMYGALDSAQYDIRVYDVTSRAAHIPLSNLALDCSRLATDEIADLTNWWKTLCESGRAERVSWLALVQTLCDSATTVALPALHGGWGEDGTLQSLMSVGGIRCAGSPARSCVLALDKGLGKAVARDLGIATARGWVLDNAEQAPPLTGKCVIKPNNGGSSVGVSILEDTLDHNRWYKALQCALEDGGSALLEEFIEGIEVTAAVVDGGNSAQCLPLIEVEPQNAYYDFHSKYAEGGARHLIPPRLPQTVLAVIAAQAVALHRAFGCKGVARSDWIVTPEGTPYFLEINTLPGMTRTSLVPDAARAAGMPFETLVEMLLEEALK